MTTPFNIEIVERDSSLVLDLTGELDMSTAPLLDDELERAEATGAPTIVIDLVHVDFIDSSGLHVLIKHACSDQHRERFRLTKGSPAVQRLFEISGALAYLPFESRD